MSAKAQEAHADKLFEAIDGTIKREIDTRVVKEIARQYTAQSAYTERSIKSLQDEVARLRLVDSQNEAAYNALAAAYKALEAELSELRLMIG